MHTMDTIHRENTIYHVYKLDGLLFLTKTLFEDSNNLNETANNLNGIENNLNGIENNLNYSKTLLVLIYKEKKELVMVLIYCIICLLKPFYTFLQHMDFPLLFLLQVPPIWRKLEPRMRELP
jgi:hypothetical protein